MIRRTTKIELLRSNGPLRFLPRMWLVVFQWKSACLRASRGVYPTVRRSSREHLREPLWAARRCCNANSSTRRRLPASEDHASARSSTGTSAWLMMWVRAGPGTRTARHVSMHSFGPCGILRLTSLTHQEPWAVPAASRPDYVQ